MAEKLVNDIFHNPVSYFHCIIPLNDKWVFSVISCFGIIQYDTIYIAIFIKKSGVVIQHIIRMESIENDIIYKDCGQKDTLPSFGDVLERYDLKMCDYVGP